MAQGAGTSIECEEDLDCGGNIGCAGDIGCNGDIDCGGAISGASFSVANGGSSAIGAARADSLIIEVGGTSSLGDASCVSLTLPNQNFSYYGTNVTWQSTQIYNVTGMAGPHYFLLSDGSSTAYGYVINQGALVTLHYLGSAAT
jgi:hypothetical protein